jgi:hypothetical protein
MSIQRYVSRELTHFVGRGLRDACQTSAECQEKQYCLLIKILRDGRLGHIARPHHGVITMSWKGAVPLSSNVKCEAQKVCFCDIPVEDLRLHMRKYSQFGLAFTKDYMVTIGATPVFYVSRKSLVENKWSPSSIPTAKRQRVALGDAFDSLGADCQRLLTPGCRPAATFPEARVVYDDLLFLEQKLAWLFFAQCKFFDSTNDEVDEENFYMEREWRVLGTVPFTLENVSRVILPSSFGKRFRADVPEYWGQVTFSD